MKLLAFFVLAAVSGIASQVNMSFFSTHSEQYDWPFYCGKCGTYHIVGACPKNKDK